MPRKRWDIEIILGNATLGAEWLAPPVGKHNALKSYLSVSVLIKLCAVCGRYVVHIGASLISYSILMLWFSFAQTVVRFYCKSFVTCILDGMGVLENNAY